MAKIELENGKYTVINALNEGGVFEALRYGEKWRNLAGDNLVLAMAHEIERLRDEISFIANVDMVTNAYDVEHVAVSVKSWAIRALEGGFAE